MMKPLKRTIALVLAALLLAFALPAVSAADDTVIASGGLHEITWTLTEDGVLTVSGKGPIVDDEEHEYDEDGEIISTSKLDCIGWQIAASFEQLTEGLSYAESLRRLIDYVKTLVIEEGITEIPDDEFSSLYPRTILLPSTLEWLGASAINAKYAESLTVNCKDLPMYGGIYIPAYRNSAKPFASVDEAIDAEVAYAEKEKALNQRVAVVYDLATAYEIKFGLTEDMTKAEFLAYFNETYGKNYTKLSTCMRLCRKRINRYFGTNYASVEEMVIVVKEDGYSYLERDPQLDDKISEMYNAIDISDRMEFISFGNETCEDNTPYRWVTINAPSGSTAEEAAKKYGLPFNATTPPERVTFLDRIRQFFDRIKAYFETMCSMLKLQLGVLK